MTDHRLLNEAEHGRFIAEHGEEIWNWSSPAGKLRWQRRVEMFRSYLGEGSRDVLEIGCGTGLFTKELGKTGHRITAIDISADLLLLAKERVNMDNVQFMKENAYATNFADESFDCIVGSSSLHHLEIIPALQEFYRLLRRGGRIMFTEPNMLNPQIALQKNILWLKRMAGDSPDETAFIRFILRRQMFDAGFKDVVITPFDFVHPALPAVTLAPVVPLLNLIEEIPIIREIAGSLLITAKK